MGLYFRLILVILVVMGDTHGTTVYRDTKFSRYQYCRGHGTLLYYL